MNNMLTEILSQFFGKLNISREGVYYKEDRPVSYQSVIFDLEEGQRMILTVEKEGPSIQEMIDAAIEEEDYEQAEELKKIQDNDIQDELGFSDS